MEHISPTKQYNKKANLFFNLCFFTILSAFAFSCSQVNPVTQPPAQYAGTVNISAGTDSGYVLFAPSNSDTTFLMDKSGNIFHYWISKYTPGMSVYLLPNGNLLRAEALLPEVCGYPGGIISVYSWNDSLLWSYEIHNSQFQQTHDVYPMPGGNVLVDVWEFIPNDTAVKYGRADSLLSNSGGSWSGKLVELEQIPGTQSAREVWSWRFWDHLESSSNPDTIKAHPELLSVNYMGTPNTPGYGDWTHMNAINYNPALHQIMISSRNLNEIYIIEYTGDSVVSAGHTGGTYGRGGDFLYRWGNPAAYNMGSTANQQLFGQHSPYWLDTTSGTANRVMINNDGFRPNKMSDSTTATIIALPVNSSGSYTWPTNNGFLPAAPVTPNVILNDSLWSFFEGSAQLLPNGNILFCAATISPPKKPAFFYEINPANPSQIIWSYKFNNNVQAFRCHQYSVEYINRVLSANAIRAK